MIVHQSVSGTIYKQITIWHKARSPSLYPKSNGSKLNSAY